MIAALLLTGLVALDETGAPSTREEPSSTSSSDLAPSTVPRVLLVQDHGALGQRLVAELRAVGLVVIERENADAISGAVVVVVVVGGEVDVSAAETGVSWHGSGATGDSDRLAVQVSERVRSLVLAESLRRRSVRTVMVPAPAAEPVVVESSVMLRAHVDSRVALYAGGIPAAIGVDVGVAGRPVPFLELGVRGSLPVTTSRVSSAEANADVWTASVQGVVSVPLRAHERVELAVSGAVGPLWLHAEGRGKGGRRGLQQDVLLTAFEVDALLRLRVVSSIWVEGGVRAAALTPRPILVVDDERLAAIDTFGAAFVVGLSGTFPDPLLSAR